jgi:ABC-type transporter Mla maintaining outer membrane lipid asymmetry ATPase subunit MlaF
VVDAVNKADSGDEAAVLIDEVFQHVGVHCALSGVSLRVARGEGLLIIGPNGAGKTLLTRLIVGLDPPSAGHVTVFGRDLAQLGNRAMRLLRRRMGAVLQRGSLLDGLSVLENVLLPLRDTPMSKNDMARAARLAMTQLQLDGMENHRPGSLSLGQRRRVELARALIHRPDLLVWDGITDGLDRSAVSEIFEVLRTQQQARGLTVIATDNSTPADVGEKDRVAVLDRGRLLFDGSRTALESAAEARLDLRYVVEGRP